VTVAIETYLSDLSAAGLLPDRYRAVLVVGSVSRGWANRGSDVDIYIVTDAPWRATDRAVPVLLDPARVGVLMGTLDGRRCEVKYWLQTQVDQMLAKVSPDRTGRSDEAWTTLSLPEKLFLERIRHAVALDGEDWLLSHRQAVLASAYRAVAVGQALGLLHGSVEDAVGQLESGDWDSAVMSAKGAFSYLVDALLAGQGEPVASPKWRARSLRQLDPPQLPYAEFWRVETMRTFDPADPRAWVEEVLVLCRRVCADIDG
jgi:Nucleotidyltransferase domain